MSDELAYSPGVYCRLFRMPDGTARPSLLERLNTILPLRTRWRRDGGTDILPMWPDRATLGTSHSGPMFRGIVVGWLVIQTDLTLKEEGLTLLWLDDWKVPARSGSVIPDQAHRQIVHILGDDLDANLCLAAHMILDAEEAE